MYGHQGGGNSLRHPCTRRRLGPRPPGAALSNCTGTASRHFAEDSRKTAGRKALATEPMSGGYSAAYGRRLKQLTDGG